MIHISEFVIGSPKRRTLLALGQAVAITLATTGLLLGMFRLSMSLEFLSPWIFTSSGTAEGSWHPVRWHWVWFGVLVSLCTTALYLAIRDARKGGGLIGAAGLVLAVPLGTVGYRRILLDFPTLVRGQVSSDVVMYYPYGFETLHRLDVAFLLALIATVFVYGRFLASRPSMRPWIRMVPPIVFLRAFFAGYMEPYPRDFTITIYPWIDSLRYVGHAVWLSTIVAVFAWLFLSGVEWVEQVRTPAA